MASRDIRYVEKDGKVVLKQNIENIDFSYKDVLHRLDILRKENADALTKIEDSKRTIQSYEEHIKAIGEELETLKKHEKKALEEQERKLLGYINDIKSVVEKRVVDEYEFDDMLTPMQNRAQMFGLYRGYLARDPKVSENIYWGLLKSKLVGNSLKLDNPFKDFVFEGIEG